MKSIIVFCLASIGLVNVNWAQWPQIQLPAGTKTEGLGDQMVVNGIPMRIQNFESTQPLPAYLAALNKTLSPVVIHPSAPGQLTLGKLQGEYYITVQVAPSTKRQTDANFQNGLNAYGTQGTLAVSHLKAAHERIADTQAEAQKWLMRLPADSRILNQTQSQDGASSSRLIMYANSFDEKVNVEKLKDILIKEGLVFEGQTNPNINKSLGSSGVAPARMIFFKGQSKEAIATIAPQPNGGSTVAVNIITQLARASR